MFAALHYALLLHIHTHRRIFITIYYIYWRPARIQHSFAPQNLCNGFWLQHFFSNFCHQLSMACRNTHQYKHVHTHKRINCHTQTAHAEQLRCILTVSCSYKCNCRSCSLHLHIKLLAKGKKQQYNAREWETCSINI